MKGRFNKKGFTLIELLAVIIILGVLLLIAIPSVTEYISSSRKKTYLATAGKYVDAVINKVNSLDYNFSDKGTMYYVPYNCIELEKGGKSPYGEWTEAYVVIVFNGDSYNYYWTSVDDSGMGIELTLSKDLSTEKIKGGMTSIDKDKTVGGRTKVGEIQATCGATPTVSDIAGGGNPIEKTYTITFDCNEVECTIDPKTVTEGQTYGELPVPPERAGYIFDGWYTEESGGIKIESTTTVTITSNQTLYTRWKEDNRLVFVANIGDYVNYDAGTWTETKARPTSSTPFTFGGYTAGNSRNSSVSCQNSTVNSGWRVLSKDTTTGEVKLIHAGQSECYYHPILTDSRGNSEKILSGSTTYTINDSSPSTPRNWSMYINSAYAVSATVFTKAMLDNWNGSFVSYGTTITNDLIKTNAHYWLGSAATNYHHSLVHVANNGYVDNEFNKEFGIRPVITMKPNIPTSGKVGNVWQLQ